MELIFASNNKNKLIEIQQLVNESFDILLLNETGITEDLPEPFDTFRANALSKAEYVFKKVHKPCFSEDSGLIVPALNGAPGVFSARYAGEPCNDQANNTKLLQSLKLSDDRSAYYQSTICLLMNNEVHYFEGQCHGKIAMEPRGQNGFGYDPIFIPENQNATFAELPVAVKLSRSHRSKAFYLLSDFLNKLSL